MRTRNRLFAAVLVALLLGVAPVYGQATGAITQILPPQVFHAEGELIYLYEMTWVSDASAGTVSGRTISLDPCTVKQIEMYPDSGGTQPTDAFDLTLLNSLGLDLLAGRGADLSNAAGTILAQTDRLFIFPGGTLAPTIAAAGNSKGGRIRIYVVK
jgi:hypothetical protein